MKLPELKNLAKQMGLRGTSTMRKPELVATLQAARNGGSAPAGVSVRVPRGVRVPLNRHGKLMSQSQAETAEESTMSELDNSETANSSSQDDMKIRRRRPLGRDNDYPRRRFASQQDHVDQQGEQQDNTTVLARDDDRDLDQILATLPSDRDDDSRQNDNNREADARRGRSARDYNRDNREDYAEGNDYYQRRGRGRVNRDHEDTRAARERSERSYGNEARELRDAPNTNREQHYEEQPQVEEQLVPVAGIIDVMESYAFVRTSGYLPGPNDVYVSMSQIKKYGLRKGDAVQGTIRAPREGERRNQRQKFVPLQAIDTINGMSVEEAAARPQFAKLTPLYPQERLKQETTPNRILGRIIDLVAPIGKGQRGLIVSPPKAGKTITLQQIANAITTNNPEVHLMVVLVDERPEEVTDMERTVQGEVISSTFDRPASDHTTVAELAIERAKRLVELGQDVVVLLDSMTRLARAYNVVAPVSGRILSGGVDAQALYPPKKFFGAARNIENGGSLTIISSALVETGSKMDEVIFEEFKGTGNMELRLSRDLADKRLYPAVDINASGTRREELITPSADLPVIYRLRRLFGGLEPEQAYQTLVPRLKKTASNRDFLNAIVQQAGSGSNNANS